MRSPKALWAFIAVAAAIGFLLGFYRIGGPVFQPLLYVVMAYSFLFTLAVVTVRRRLLMKEPLPRWARWAFEKVPDTGERP